MKAPQAPETWLLLFSICQTALFGAPGDENWDSSFGVPGSPGARSYSAICVLGSDVYFGGPFRRIGLISATNIARWDGTNWHEIGGGTDGRVYALTASGRDLYAGGDFTQAGAVPASRVARWDGTNWSSLGAGFIRRVHAVEAGEQLYVGGFGTHPIETNATNVAAWDGMSWSPLGEGVSVICGDKGSFECGTVHALAAEGTNLYVAGSFRSAGGTEVNNIALWNGAYWSLLGAGLRTHDVPNQPNALNGVVLALALGRNKLYAGGDFSRAGDILAKCIAEWDGTNWFSMGSGIVGPVDRIYALAFNGSDLYAGGCFSSISGVPANNIARWDGTNWFPLGSGIAGCVGSLAANGTELYVQGAFNAAGNKPSTNIALWHIPHALSITRSGDSLALSWPATGSNLLLQAASALDDTNWVQVPQPPTILNDQCVVTNDIFATRQFYRLRRK